MRIRPPELETSICDAKYHVSLTTQGRCLRTPHQLQANVREQYPNEASQQEESNATTLTSIGAIYRRQSKKIRFRQEVGRERRKISVESGAQNLEGDVGQTSIPVRRRARQIDEEVFLLASHVDEMELVMARFHRMNPQTFTGVETTADAESWLEHI
ncbi:hypothetical protein F511_31907 [Dorcoceras hygrometricum]|uniref:Uncharacterized protein n=1 Tax=Dorcoceras hygrometricum TaxID=472368 RepID=A0A2Z7DCP7_9LAMI|nr:hypothetical protein F511_31907 [Dorcoceras hygrometricum]